MPATLMLDGRTGSSSRVSQDPRPRGSPFNNTLEQYLASYDKN